MQGIYKIRCSQDSRVYIGSSKNITRRWAEHRKALNSNTHRNYKLQEDWDCYGDESFTFEIIEETAELVTREQFYLNQVRDSCYNISIVVTNPMSNPEVVKKQQDALNLSGKRGGQKLTQQQVFEIVDLLKNKHTASYVAKKYNVSNKLIAGIVSGSKWKSVTDITGLPRKQKIVSEEDIKLIEKLSKAGVTKTEIARIIGVSYTTIRTHIAKIKK